jgi:hypothetical protein
MSVGGLEAMAARPSTPLTGLQPPIRHHHGPSDPPWLAKVEQLGEARLVRELQDRT